MTDHNAWFVSSFYTELTHFCTVLKKNCTALNQSEWRNFFMYILLIWKQIVYCISASTYTFMNQVLYIWKKCYIHFKKVFLYALVCHKELFSFFFNCRGGFYTLLLSKGFRLVSLNMNYCNNMNWFVLKSLQKKLMIYKFDATLVKNEWIVSLHSFQTRVMGQTMAQYK